MDGLGEAACALARLGWAVLPLRPGGKAPAVAGGCRSASADPAQAAAWWTARPDDNVGVACGAASGGLFVLDFDVDGERGEDGLATLAAWEREHGRLPETVAAVSGRGGMHLYYRTDAEVRNSANPRLGVDVRGEGGYVAAPPSLHPSGRPYAWAREPGRWEVAEADGAVMDFVRFVQGKDGGAGARETVGGRPPAGPKGAEGTRFELPETVPAGSRDDTLFRYASSLQARGVDDAGLRAAVEAANRERCAPPLPARDVERIVRGVTGRYGKGADGGRGMDGGGLARTRAFRKTDRAGRPTGAVLHNVVARELIAVWKVRFVDGAPAVWAGGRYETGWDAVDRAVVSLVDDCKLAEQREVRHYVHLMAPRVRAARPTLLAFANGVLDLEAEAGRDFGAMDPEEAIANVIPHDWEPGAYDGAADAFLDRVSCGDATVRANLEEVVGVCMFRSSEFGQCPVLLGSGSNGKSTFILALRNVLGDENVSSLDLSTVGRQFQAGRLLGKLANLGDDISNERLSGDVLAVFKKVVTGEWVYSDVKNSDGFEFKPYCTLVFSCNEFPSLGDSSEGMLRRLFPVPFLARFERTDPGYDPRIGEKLRSEGAARYLARVGVEGLRRVIAQNGFTRNDRSEELVGEVRADNDTVLQWTSERGLLPVHFEGCVIADCYEEYAQWCDRSRLRPYGRTKFTRKIGAMFGFASHVEKRSYAGGARCVRVFRPAEVSE